MSTHRHIDRICWAALAFTLILSLVFANAEKLGVTASAGEIGYESRLFDTSRVHTLDIVIDDWDGFLETCESEEYSACSVVIDGESYKNIAIRAKGNTSLSSVAAYGNDRYSFKLEFDHYESGKTYHGLDKLSLNNLIQDNTYMKDYLCYTLMGSFGVAAPLCSYVYITVNGEDWGLYLAVEGVEESFLERNYGSDYGELYKPDSMSMGGGRGNGADFDMDDFTGFDTSSDTATPDTSADSSTDASSDGFSGFTAPQGGGDFTLPDGASGFDPGDFDFDSADFDPGGFDFGDFGGGGFSLGDGASLEYTDDDPDSYSVIFDSAKTDVTEADENRLIASLKQLSEGEDLESVLDIDELLRYFVVHNFVVNGDSYTGSMLHNYYLYEEDGQLSMIPWDYNLAFGGFQGGDADSAVNDPIDTPLSVTGDGSRPMVDWIFSGEEYTELYHEYFSEFLDSVDLDALISETEELISPYVEKDPTSFCTYEEFQTGVSALKEFCALRTESVRGQLDGSIPSTSAGQSADPDSLVDASSVSLSDMGSMNTGGGNGGGAPDMQFDMPSGFDPRSEAGTADTDADTEDAGTADAAPDADTSATDAAPADTGTDADAEDAKATAASLDTAAAAADTADTEAGADEGTAPVDTGAGAADGGQSGAPSLPDNMTGTPPDGSFPGTGTTDAAPSDTSADTSTDTSADTAASDTATPDSSSDTGTADSSSDAGTADSSSDAGTADAAPSGGGGDFTPQQDSARQGDAPSGTAQPGTAQSASGYGSLITLGVCVLVLLAGLVFAVKFKR